MIARGWRAAAAALMIVGAPAAAGAAEQTAAGRTWALKIPSVERVVFRGAVSHDAAGMGTGAMLYPAPNAAGLLAAILTHGLLNEGAKQSQKDKLQSEADEVLRPFRSFLDGFTHSRLIESALPLQRTRDERRPLGPNDSPGPDWTVEVAPVFSMTRDQRALVLDNAVRIYAPASADAAYAQTIRVVSHPAAVGEGATAEAIESHWRAEEGRRLLELSAALLAESLDVAMQDSRRQAAAADAPQRTFRYAEGSAEKIERASLVEAQCGRLLLRTLRGWLMSVPAAARADPAACAPRRAAAD